MATGKSRNVKAAAGELVTQLTAEVPAGDCRMTEVREYPAARAILAGEPQLQVAVLRKCVSQVGVAFPAKTAMVSLLLRQELPLSDADLAFIAERMAAEWYVGWTADVGQLVTVVEDRTATGALTPELRAAMKKLQGALGRIANAPERKLRARVDRLFAGSRKLPLEAGEAWSDAAISHINALSPETKAAWMKVLLHCAGVEGPAPAKRWLRDAVPMVRDLPPGEFERCVQQWFPLVNKPRTKRVKVYSAYQPDRNLMIIEPHMQLLKGMAWICGGLDEEQLARTVAQLAKIAYRKIPMIGPRAVSVGNACITALSMMSGATAIGQLGILRAAVKFSSAQKMIEKAFGVAADRLGLPRDEVEEMGVPVYGLEEVGYRRDELGEYVAEIRVRGREVTLGWSGPGGKAVKSVPARVKSEHKEELKELQGAVKDIAAMLPAQAERIDAMYLLQKRWAWETWKERYLDHPLIGTIARRLIWVFTNGGSKQAAMYWDGRLVNVDDEPVEVPEGAEVELWHPIGRDLDDVMAWRTFVQRHEIRQPFKQAYREVYVLTEAERRTRTYSNRFAAHILRQHQFNALCAVRGWKNKLRLMVDDVYPPATRELPQWGLRAEFWVDGVGEDYGTDTNESGVFLRLSTDQVRFYGTGAAENLAHAYGGVYESRAAGPGAGDVNEPLALEEIPPLVLSEILRDVDLFVGVASIGNDPTWQDGGPGGRYRAYWHDYSFGELSETAKTRKAVLETLIRRLSKIRQRCSLTERFLVVKGDLRTYKIHLGSGNILMEPNDEYLCIVPDRSAETTDVFLPFEGDATLAIILSKAFLLAEDRKIKDVTITRQIRRE